ncbi:Rieske (2Fe-2S) protein [Chloroflexi bacterium TSY]|nr:Rieske (2Fe-2S) protein [Chloroflexi bacterium TSY]
MAKYEVASVDEIPPGERKLMTVAGRPIGVFNIDGEYFALRSMCPHQGGPLCEGLVTGFLMSQVPGEYEYTRQGEILRCPWHGWEFDVKTGQSWVDPEKTRVRTYPVSIEAVQGESVESQTVDTDPEVREALVDPETGRVPGPYTAETYPVSVERQVIFVEI